MGQKLTADDIDLIMNYIPSVTDIGVNTELWNKLKRMKEEPSYDEEVEKHIGQELKNRYWLPKSEVFLPNAADFVDGVKWFINLQK